MLTSYFNTWTEGLACVSSNEQNDKWCLSENDIVVDMENMAGKGKKYLHTYTETQNKGMWVLLFKDLLIDWYLKEHRKSRGDKVRYRPSADLLPRWLQS